MNWFIIFFGLYAMFVGVMLILFPAVFKKKMTKLLSLKNYKALGVVTAIIGLLFLLASSGAKMSLFIVLIGILSLLKGFFFIFAAHDKIKFLINWWLSLPTDSCRIWGIMAFTMGLLLIVAGA
ncbi:MAG: hypothetical protein KAJ66_05395 [Candidatus Omnitrophica bacterium]|nr:hypothetical protein [Candidatus Omnitrophota bacterium]